MLKSMNKDEQNLECSKVFNFFRKVLDLPEINQDAMVESDATVTLPTQNNQVEEASNMFPPVGGKLPEHPRGAQ